VKDSDICAKLGPPSKDRPRIVIFADSPLPSLKDGPLGRGGGQAATWLSQVAEEFGKAADLEIIWIELRPKTRASGLEHRGSQTFIHLGHPRQSWDLALGFHLVRWRLRRLLRMLRPGVVHCWGTERLHAAATEVAPCPVILSMQGILSEYQRIGGMHDVWQWRALANNEPRWVKAATEITCESQWGLEQLRRLGRHERMRQIEYGVHPSFYELKWQPDPQDPFLLFSGSVDWRKGVDVLAEAAAVAAGRKWRLEIAGDGPLKASLEARNLPNVKCLGNLDWPTLQDRLTKAWGFILPTRADTSPNSVKEARVVGLPVVTTPSGGQSGYIIDGQNGFLVDPLDAPGLLAACDKVTASLDTAITMGRARHQQDRDYFRPQNTASSFLLLYRELSGANPA